MNVEIGTEAAQFPEKKYINGIFVAVWPNGPYKFSIFMIFCQLFSIGILLVSTSIAVLCSQDCNKMRSDFMQSR
jgi:hypothetical protein